MTPADDRRKLCVSVAGVAATSVKALVVRESQMQSVEPCWVENKCAALIERIRRSQFALDCFSDARMFMEEGFASDVALAKAWAYWGS